MSDVPSVPALYAFGIASFLRAFAPAAARPHSRLGSGNGSRGCPAASEIHDVPHAPTPVNPEYKTPRCPYDKVGGLVFLGRTIDKIRLKAAGQLRPDFFRLMGDGYDGRIMKYLGLDYAKFAEFVLTGASDDECWQYCVQNGRKLTDVDVLVWNDFAAKRGWRDSVSELLEKFKAESGLAHRTDLQTFFEYWEVDEGRKP